MPAQGIIRVMLGDFPDQKTANEIAIALRKSGSFPQAFVVKE
ncbi:MAG: SPOR domain-containing protein [Lewinellaceae bacterium]|nr:SPOR domain-containing protein [Lewinellaceae bacterium]